MHMILPPQMVEITFKFDISTINLC